MFSLERWIKSASIRVINSPLLDFIPVKIAAVLPWFFLCSINLIFGNFLTSFEVLSSEPSFTTMISLK